MRFFEGILFVSTVLYIVVMNLYKVSKVGVIAFFTILLPIIFLLHYIIEGISDKIKIELLFLLKSIECH
ncbi:hypothetical protein KPL26_04620 [Clostridium algidicarnis]|uniref:hypothetical protein n=1 Tax=Clostridium algidicarnis TaxID=37659 RepID=UPI001C0B38DB|nr:hypothetical protein [Clostridium algidicarnis]MBU3195950.1 hypothetical protein [Clostridium algidicarnis]